MVPPWLAKNPRAGPDLEFGREQQFVIDPDGIPELCDMLTECPKHSPTPLYALPSLAAKLGLGEIRVKDESQRFGFGAFKALGGVIAVYYELLRALGEAQHLQRDLCRPHERQASRDHVAVHLRHGELGQPWPLGRRRRQAVRQSLRRLPAEIHQCREGSGDPRPRRQGDPRRWRLRHRRRRVPAQVRGEWLDDHLGHLVGRLRFGAAQRHARLLRAGARGGRAAMARRGRRMCSSRPASAGLPPR